MSSYSRIFHHITVEEVKRSERDRNLLEKIEEFKEEEIIEPVKHIDWRKDVGEEKIEENMETTGFMNIIYPSMADTNIQTLANAEEASYSTTTFGNGNTCAPYGDAGSTPSASSLNANGTGTGDGGDTGNFDVGAGYAFIPLGAYGGDDNDGQLNLAPVDAREYDTIVVQAQVGDGTNGGRAPTDSYLDDPNEIGYGGLMVSYYLPQMDNTDANTDSWSLDSYIEKYEPGYSRETDPDYTDNILPLWRDALPEGISQLREYSILIPPWAQKENVTFNVYGIGPLVEGTGIGGDIAVKNVYFRRLQPVSVVASLDSPAASAFIHDGAMSGWKGSREKKRRELARQMKQSNIYLEKKFGPGFPGTGALPPGENQHGSRSWREAQRKDNPNFPRGMESRADHADSVKDHRGEPLFPEGYRTWYTRTGGRAAPGSHDSYRMQMVGRTPGVKYTTRKQSISRAPRSRTAADIKRDFEAGKHISHAPHREKWLQSREKTQQRQREAQYQRSLTKWKSDVAQWEKKTGIYGHDASSVATHDKAYKMDNTSQRATSMTPGQASAWSADKFGSGQQTASGDMWDKVLKDIEKSSDKLKNQPQKDHPYYGRPGRGMGDRWKAQGDSGQQVAHVDDEAWKLKDLGHPKAGEYHRDHPGKPNPYLSPGDVKDLRFVMPGLLPMAKGAQDGQQVAWGSKPKVPTSKSDFGAIKRRTAETDAIMIQNGMGMSPDAFKKKYGITPQQWQNLPQQQSRGRSNYQVAHYEPQEPLLSEKKSSLKSPNQFFNPADIKPVYPDASPPELTKRGYHPDLEAGEKVSNRYNKLDPISARSMPKTGNPHIDRKVAKAAKKPLRSPKEMREGLTVA